jgi:hypothetical protein
MPVGKIVRIILTLSSARELPISFDVFSFHPIVLLSHLEVLRSSGQCALRRKGVLRCLRNQHREKERHRPARAPMGTEHQAAVWEHSRQSGSSLIVLLAVADHCDSSGEWVIDQTTLQHHARLSNRRVRQVLAELIAAGELAVVSHHGRGKLSTYRLLVGQENWKPAAALAQKEEASSRFSNEKPEADSQFQNPLSPPFPPDPLYPLNPPKQQETFGLRPLTGPQSSTFRVNLLLEEAGVPLPSPAQIGLWSKTLGGIEPLLVLLGRLVQAGLANKREPIAYVHRVVMERAARPEPTRPLSARAGRDLLRTAGADDIRRAQALRIIAGKRGPS